MKRLVRHEYIHLYDIHTFVFRDLQDNADANWVLLSISSVKGGKL